jgi:hypothetical protein
VQTVCRISAFIHFVGKLLVQPQQACDSMHAPAIAHEAHL